MSASTPPFLIVTAVLDASARPAAVTRSHGEALERALRASSEQEVAGLDIVELPIAPHPFGALRKHVGAQADAVAVYDLFPVSAKLEENLRRVTGQFLAAEVLWTLDEQGLLSGVPFSIKLDLPTGWDKAPKEVHAKLMEAGALDLDKSAVETFKAVKTAWDKLNGIV